jgi:hypothetical protein
VLTAAAAASLVLVAGCASGTESQAPPAQGAASSIAAPSDWTAQGILTKLGLTGRSATEVVEALDQKSGERQRDVLASVRYDSLVLKDDSGESQVELPDGQFYLSVAPYVSRTHECYYHSLTTCTGELADQIVDVTIVDSAGKTLVDGPARTYANGFVGFWLPRDIEGTITVTHEGRTATSAISTGQEAPTCLTTLQLT